MTKNRPKIGPMLRLVLAVGALLSPLAVPLLKRRLARGKEDPQRWREKLSEATQPRPDGPLVWMHGVGVGEVMALRGVIEAMSIARSDLSFLLTSTARSSGGVIAANLPARTQHQYLPLDLPKPACAFLDHWRPDLAVWSDQDIWPRLVVTASRHEIPQALVAARITAASAKAKARFGSAFGDLYRLLDLRHAQDAATAQRLRDLMGDDTPVQVTASLKPAAAPLAGDAQIAAQIMDLARPVWVAASAHPADIDVALDAQRLCNDTRLLIVVPRDLKQAGAIKTACQQRGLSFKLRSDNGLPDSTCAVFIADTFGELGIWYRCASAALIGGTFDDTQGHNPWEAVALDCAVLHGPNVANFARDFDQLSAQNAAVPVRNAAQIVQALDDPNLPDRAARAMDVREHAARGMTQTTQALLSLLRI